jgi:tetratricopeptide (TPR) repeat protein
MGVRKAFIAGRFLLAMLAVFMCLQSLSSHVLAEASRSITNLITPEPVTPIEHNNRANELDVHGRWYEAIQEYTLALQGDPKNNQFKTNFSACLVRFGDALMDRHDFRGALNQYQRSLELNPDNLSAKSGLGEVQNLISTNGTGRPM